MAAVWELKVRPLGPIGAEVQGVDLARVSGTQIEAIKRAWHRHDVLVFRNQQLTDDHLLSFSRHFGRSIHHPTKALGASHPPAIQRCTSSPTCSTAKASRLARWATGRQPGTPT
jgi:alpha-ketoglutarate-dependent taurine dioxygenase